MDISNSDQQVERTAVVPLLLSPTASRLPSNASITSTRKSASRSQTFSLELPSSWSEQGPLFDWYQGRLRSGEDSVNLIQLRRERSAPYHHEFLVIHTTQGKPFRIDRRPDPRVPLDGITIGCAAVDTISTPKQHDIKKSECILVLRVCEQITIESLVRICINIKSDSQSCRYTIQTYNCYFFAWAIIMIVMRQSAVWDKKWGSLIMEERRHSGCTWEKVFKKVQRNPTATWFGAQLRHIVLKDPTTGDISNKSLLPNTPRTILDALKPLMHVDVLPHLTAADVSQAFWVHVIYTHIARSLKSTLESLLRDMTDCEDTLEVVSFMMQPSFHCENISSFHQHLCILSTFVMYARSRI